MQLNGDWGGQDSYPYTEPGQVLSAKGMDVTAKEVNPQAIFLLGGTFVCPVQLNTLALFQCSLHCQSHISCF